MKVKSGDAGWRLPLVVQAISLQACWVAARLMIGYRALHFDAGPLGLGIVAASFAAPALLAALPAGRLADRRGGMALVVAGIIVLTAGVAGAAFSPTLIMLICLSLVVGLGQLLTAVGQQSFIGERAAQHTADSAFGFLTSAVSVGQVIGPLLAAWAATAGLRDVESPDTTVALLVAAVLPLVAAVPCWFLIGFVKPELAPASRSERGVRAILRTPSMWRALAVSGVVLASMDMLYAFLPAWALDNQVSVVVVGNLLALRAMVTVVSRFGLARLVNRFGRKALLLVSLVLAMAALTTLPLVGAFGAVFVMIALGVGLGLPQPLTMAWVVSRANPSIRGAALGLRLTSNRLMQLVIPVAIGAAAAPLGSAGIFWASAVLLTGAAGVVGTAGRSLDAGPPVEPDSV